MRDSQIELGTSGRTYAYVADRTGLDSDTGYEAGGSELDLDDRTDEFEDNTIGNRAETNNTGTGLGSRKRDIIGGDDVYDELNAGIRDKGPKDSGIAGMEEGYGASKHRSGTRARDNRIRGNLGGCVCPFSIRGRWV